MTEDQIKHMVDRFLLWELPDNFNPDCGVTFRPIGNEGTPFEYRRKPCGTNILNATEARAMVTHMLDGLPNGDADEDARVLDAAIERVEAARETFRLALPGSDEEFAAGLAGFDMALSALKKGTDNG